MENNTLNDIYKVVIGMSADIREMKADIKRLDEKIDNVEKKLNKEIENSEKNLKQYIKKEIKETEDATCMYLEENFVRKKCV